jgi:hypothetical protein
MNKQQISRKLIILSAVVVFLLYWLGNNAVQRITDRVKSNISTKNQGNEPKPTSGISQKTSDLAAECQIIRPRVQQYRVTIDGVEYPRYVPLLHNKSLDFGCMRKINSKPKLILFWTTYFADEKWWYGLGKTEPFARHRCPVDNCELTSNKSRLNESDFVVFHMYEWVNSKYSIEKIVRPNQDQRWIFWIHEPPMQLHTHESRIGTPVDFSGFKNLFNLSATYRLETDITSFYYESDFVFDYNPDFDVNRDFSSGKTKFAVMVASNCKAQSGRLEYVRNLQTLIPVDILGKLCALAIL